MKNHDSGALGAELRSAVRGRVLVPGDAEFDIARRPWNAAVDQRVRAVVEAEDARDVAAVVGRARRAGLAVSAQPDGHGATGAADGTILLRTGRMRGVAVDPLARVARVEAGALWNDVIPLAAKHGLAGLAGSSPGPSVVGYTLGGGLSWFGRRYGFAANSVRSFDVVDADGAAQRVSERTDPELFWALRGGGGDFALVTAMEFDLFPVARLYGGRVLWPAERAAEVLAAFRETTAEAPEELTLWFTMLCFPPVPEVPEPLRGVSAVAMDVTYLGAPEEARGLLRRFHDISGQMLNTWGEMPLTEIGAICAEPMDPTPMIGRADLLTRLDDEAVATVLDESGILAGGIDPLAIIQIRQLGGALARPVEGGGAAGRLSEPFLVNALGAVPFPEAGRAARARLAALSASLAPFASGRTPYTFLDGEEKASAAFPAGTVARLRDIKRRRDPRGLVRANHPVLA